MDMILVFRIVQNTC